MFRKNRLYLIIGMEQWKDRTKKFENICILTLKECLKDMGESYTTEKAIVDKIYDFICSMARKRGFQIHQVILDLKDKYIKSFEMLEELRIEKEPLAFDVAQNNLQFIPTLVQFLGRNWFQKRIKEKDETHLLMIWLSKLQPSDGKIRDPNKHSEHEEKEAASDPVTSIELKNLEKCLKLFGRTEQGMSRIVDGWIEEEG